MRTIRTASLVVAAAACLLIAVFAFFAAQLASGQTRSRNEIETEVKDRAVLSAALLDSLFQTVQQDKGHYSADYSGTVSPAQLDEILNGAAYIVITDSEGGIVAQSSGFRGGSGVALARPNLVNLLRSGRSYELGNVASYGSSAVVDLAVPFSVPGGQRILITGLKPAALGSFFDNELHNIPGVTGEVNYLVDGAGRVVGSSDPRVTFGTPLPSPGMQALVRGSGGYRGTFFQQAPLRDSQWRIVLSVPEGPLFASVDGARELVPWIIFAALVLAAGLAAALGWRVVEAAATVKVVNARLAAANKELLIANGSLQRRAAELARSNEELDSFASIASHDLQEPLRKVRTFTEQLAVVEGPRLSDQGRDYLRRANQAAERMQRLVEDLLKFSRVGTQARPFSRVDLAEIADRVTSDLEGQIAATGAEISIDELPVIDADPLQMQQLLQNLISNALKFRREGVPPRVDVASAVDGDTLTLSVQDNGIGFEARYAARIFRIFERLHGRNEYPGTGIGLALCRKIADRHGGTIEADGEPGRGSTFTVFLPMTHSHPEAELRIDLVQKEELTHARI